MNKLDLKPINALDEVLQVVLSSDYHPEDAADIVEKLREAGYEIREIE